MISMCGAIRTDGPCDTKTSQERAVSIPTSSSSKMRPIQGVAYYKASLAFMFTGAALSWPSPALPKYKSGEVDIQITDAQTSWVVALVGLGALPGCYLGQIAVERIGRRRTIFASSLPALIGSIMILLTKLPTVIYIARFLVGVATGVIAVVTMIFITEIADKDIRGALGMLVQVMGNLGCLLVYGIGPFVSYNMLNSMLISIPIFYVICCSWLPESPYYYLKEGRVDLARKEFVKLKGCNNEKWVDEQLDIIRINVKESMEHKTNLKELLTNMNYRKAIYIVGGLKAVQYMTGMLAIQTYLEMIFRQSSSISGPHASIVYGFVQLAAGIAATFLAGWFGRRILMIISCLGVALSLTLVGIYFYLQDSIQVNPYTLSLISPVPLIGILGFNIMYAIGIGNLPYVMQAELFPINVKTVASSTATMVSCVLNFIVTKSYQGVKDSFGHYTVFWSFAVIAYLGVVFIYLFVPETKGRTLEEVHSKLKVANPEEQALRGKSEQIDK